MESHRSFERSRPDSETHGPWLLLAAHRLRGDLVSHGGSHALPAFLSAKAN